jgi:hypothetical protein
LNTAQITAKSPAYGPTRFTKMLPSPLHAGNITNGRSQLHPQLTNISATTFMLNDAVQEVSKNVSRTSRLTHGVRSMR